MALRCSIRYVSSGSSPVAFARTANSGRPIPQRHSLTLIVSLSETRSRSWVPRSLTRPESLTGCVCLHALSSFQRTDCDPGFAIPERRRALWRLADIPSHRPGLARKARRLPIAARLGEPSKVTRTNPILSSRPVNHDEPPAFRTYFRGPRSIPGVRG